MISESRQFWKLRYDQRSTQTWNRVFLLLELCLSAPYSNVTLERFFSQMCVVKTDWRNQVNEENLTHLLRVKVVGPTIEEFHANRRGKGMTLWYSDRNCRMHQPKQKAYKKREIKQTETESLNFNLISIFEDSDSGSDNNSNVDFD